MTVERPIIRVPEGWTYAEESEYSCGRWETVYRITHIACGTPHTEFCRSVGEGSDGWWYREQCAKGLGFFIGIHPQNCEPKV